MPKSNHFTILILFCFSFFFVQAQEKEKQLTLKSILKNISQIHDVSFNYLEDEIVVFKLVEPDKNWSLAEKISYIQKETKLSFSVTNNKYYNIFNDKRFDKPLCGYILNSKTNDPIGFANISILNTTISTVSQENGYFELPIVSGNNIQISHISFEKKEISPQIIYTSNCPTIFLNPIIIPLEEVISQTYLTSGISIKNDGTIQIKPKKIGHLPGLIEPDVFRTLQQIPGITSVDESISNINVRGGTHDQNLILWNGIRLFQTGHFFGLISALNPNLAHNVKISKNGSSAFYGESTSSVIDISTHTAEIEKNTGAMGVNMINGDFYTKLKTSKNSNIEVSARRSFTDLVNSPTYTQYSNRIFQNTEVTNTADNQNITYVSDENFYFYDATFQFHQKIKDKTHLYIDAIGISNQLDLNQSKIENINTITRNSCLEQETLGSNLSLISDWNKKNSLQFSAYISYYKVTSENESIETNQIFNQSNDILDSGIRLMNHFAISKRFNVNAGYHFNEIGIRNIDKINSPFFFRRIKEVLKNHIGILELLYYSNNQKLKSTIGIRGNHYDELATTILEPRLQLFYSFNPVISTQILAEIKNQTTSQIIDLQQDFLGIEKRRWVISNGTTIPIIKSNQASIGFTYKKNKLLITLDNYYKKVKGITSKSQGFQNQLEFSTLIGDYTVIGSEVLIQKQINAFTTWLSYSFSDNNYDFSEVTPSIFPNNFEITHNIGFAIIFDNTKLKLALGSRWHSGKPTTTPEIVNPISTNTQGPEINYTSPNTSNLDDYFQMNFSGSYAFEISKNSKLQLGFSVENILDTKNTINQYYRINQNTNTVEKVNTFSLKRTPNAFLRFSF